MGKYAVTEPGHSCVHCGATETPLWRRGPDGKRTLCNACGVRLTKKKLQLYRNREGNVTCIKTPGNVPINNPPPLSPRRSRKQGGGGKGANVQRKDKDVDARRVSIGEWTDYKVVQSSRTTSSCDASSFASPAAVTMANTLYQEAVDFCLHDNAGCDLDDTCNLDPLSLVDKVEPLLSSAELEETGSFSQEMVDVDSIGSTPDSNYSRPFYAVSLKSVLDRKHQPVYGLYLSSISCMCDLFTKGVNVVSLDSIRDQVISFVLDQIADFKSITPPSRYGDNIYLDEIRYSAAVERLRALVETASMFGEDNVDVEFAELLWEGVKKELKGGCDK